MHIIESSIHQKPNQRRCSHSLQTRTPPAAITHWGAEVAIAASMCESHRRHWIHLRETSPDPLMGAHACRHLNQWIRPREPSSLQLTNPSAGATAAAAYGSAHSLRRRHRQICPWEPSLSELAEQPAGVTTVEGEDATMPQRWRGE